MKDESFKRKFVPEHAEKSAESLQVVEGFGFSMICYKCGSELTGEDFCGACRADVKMYIKIIHLSNRHYNEGLERAKVRDLSGAVESLRKSLKYYKLNIQARNLLGLVYFEMGETVDALGEWVISRSILPEKNPAERYLSAVQSNKNKLDALNQTIKKYNQALLYCRQGSKDLAGIQLKKVLTLNPRLVKGHQLLALLYMMEEENYDLALKSLRNAEKIDAGNTTTLRYQKELKSHIRREQPAQKSKRKEKEDVVSYQSGNETIINPAGFKDYSAVSTIINIIIGIAIGVLVTYFLVIPGVKQTAERDAKKAVQEASDTVSTKNQTVKALETQVTDLEQEITKMKEDSSSNQDTIAVYENLLAACDAFYVQEDMERAKTELEKVNAEVLTQRAKAVYDALNAKASEEYMDTLYPEGEAAYNQQDYAKAAEIFQKIADSDENYREGYTIYYLAQSYRKLEDYENASKYYQKVVELYPGSQRARNSTTYLNQIEDMSQEE